MLRHLPSDFQWSSPVSRSLPDGDVLFAVDTLTPWTQPSDPQGEYLVIARLDSGQWLRYCWAYGSCDVCDVWRGLALEEIALEVTKDAQVFSAEEMADSIVDGMGRKEAWTKLSDQRAGLLLTEVLELVLRDIPRREFVSIRDWSRP